MQELSRKHVRNTSETAADHTRGADRHQKEPAETETEAVPAGYCESDNMSTLVEHTAHTNQGAGRNLHFNFNVGEWLIWWALLNPNCPRVATFVWDATSPLWNRVGCCDLVFQLHYNEPAKPVYPVEPVDKVDPADQSS